MEIYVAYQGILQLDDGLPPNACLMKCICMDEVNVTVKVKVGDNVISFGDFSKRITMRDDAIPRCHLVGPPSTVRTRKNPRAAARGMGIEVDDTTRQGSSDEMFGEKCEGSYIQPTFITDYPIEMSPLPSATDNPELTERFF